MKLSVWYILLAVIGIAFGSQAQTNSRLGRFQVDQVKGCAPFTVTITINAPDKCSTNPGESCDMLFGDSNTSNLLTFTHTYTQPGNFLLEIIFNTSGTDDIPIEVFPNTPPEFELYTCGNNEISVNITDTNYDEYIVNYNDGSPEISWSAGDAAPQHSYAGPGSKTVSVRGINSGAIDNCSSNTQTVNALVTLPAPVITQLQVIDGASIQLDYNSSPNILYRLEIATNNATTFQLFKTSYNLTSETLANLKPDDNYYCFRLGAFDPCNNITAYSNTICSANLDLNIQNNSNNVRWTTSTSGVSDLRLNRSTTGSSFTTTVSTSPYSDTDITCGTDYCYKLTTNYSNGSQSISLQKCGTAISTDAPDPIENITAIVSQPGLELQWEQVTGYTPSEFSVFKSGANVYNLLMKTTGLQVADERYVTESAACYKVSYVDACGNESPLSAESCPIRLNGHLQKNNSINLTWSPYSGWREGVSNYVVEKYSADGQLLQSFNTGSALNFLDDTEDLNHQAYRYIVKANAVGPGLPQAVSNPVNVIKDPNLFYPTAFTPNGDNLNDIFNVYGQYIVSFEMNIFNRWGELMYTTTQLGQGWDGFFKGNPMPEGTYTFVADLTDHAGRTFKKSGSVLLLRKE